jgi:hypothetical protein
MKRYVEPLYLKSGIGFRKIPLGKELCDAEHLLETMEMVQRAREELLVDAMVPTRCQVVVLAIPGFFLIKSANQEEVDCMQEVLSQSLILCRLGNFWDDRLRETLVENLLPVGLVVAEEHIAELGKACDVVQVQFSDARMNLEIVLSRVNLIPSRPSSMWISALCGLLLCNL